MCFINNSTIYRASIWDGTTQINSSITILPNVWTHVAWVRQSSTLNIYTNGVSGSTTSAYTTNWTASTSAYIGAYATSNNRYFPGYISNLRVVKGTAVYTGNFTPSTTSLVPITNTSLLLNTPNNANAFVDSSTNNFTVTVSGNVPSTSITPNNSSNPSASGSLGFNGTSQYLTVPSNAAFTMGTGDFTIEAWIYLTTAATNGAATTDKLVFGGFGFTPAFVCFINNSTIYRASIWNGTTQTNSSITILPNVWTHVAWVRQSSTLNIYTNGVSGSTTSAYTTNWTASTSAYIGRADSSNDRYFPGYISNLRVVKGAAVYTTAFVPTDQPLTAITNTSLLLNTPHNANAFVDSSTNNFTVTVLGNVPAISNVPNVGYSSPTQIGTSSWTLISAGGSHTVATRIDGGLFTWGSGNTGQLGNGLTTNRASPSQVGASSWTSISAGASDTYAIASATNLMYAWGLNTSGQLADSTIINRSSPIQINTATMTGAAYIPINLTAVRGSSWTQVAAGNAITAIANNSLLYIWGYNIGGTIGNLTIDSSSSPTVLGNASIPFNASPTQIGTSSWTTISAGNKHVLALNSDTTLWAWGGRASLVPMNIEYTQIEAGYSHFIALRSDGSIWTWGDNTYGQLGDTSIVNKSSPVQLGMDSWSVIAAGLSHTAGIKTDGTLWVWGLGTSGQLGQGDILSRSSPVQVGTSSWTLVAAGSSHTIAVGQNNLGLYAWGYNVAGQLGDNTVVAKSSPILVSGTSTTSFIQLAAGNQNSMFLNSNFGAYVWGSGNTGQLGNGLTTGKSSPTQVGALLYKAITLSTDSAVTGATSYAIRTDGILYAWGLNTSGQLADSTILNKSSPIQVNSTNTYDKIKGAHNNHVQGLRSDGTLWVWGNNTSGALGDGTINNKSSPVQLSTFTYGNIGAGPSLTSAYLDRLGQLYTTGVTSAALGSFNTPNTTGAISRSSPAQIGYYIGNSPIQIGSNLWSAISAGNDSSLIANSTKALYFWGVNSNYQSGNVSTPVTANVSSPTLIGTAASSISDGNVNAGYIKKS